MKMVQWGVGTEISVDAEIEAALNTDLDTSRAVMRLREIEKSSLQNKDSIFRYADQVLGLDLERPIVQKVLTAEMQRLLDERALARREKRWSDSDQLRDKLENLGLDIKDTPEGQGWS
jgi:cysteinyl-tRNA synthetase